MRRDGLVPGEIDLLAVELPVRARELRDGRLAGLQDEGEFLRQRKVGLRRVDTGLALGGRRCGRRQQLQIGAALPARRDRQPVAGRDRRRRKGELAALHRQADIAGRARCQQVGAQPDAAAAESVLLVLDELQDLGNARRLAGLQLELRHVEQHRGLCVAGEIDRHQLGDGIEIEPELPTVQALERTDRMRNGAAAPPGRRRQVERRRVERHLAAENPVFGRPVGIRGDELIDVLLALRRQCLGRVPGRALDRERARRQSGCIVDAGLDEQLFQIAGGLAFSVGRWAQRCRNRGKTRAQVDCRPHGMPHRN